ncbi:MAG: hypothetical protein GY859_28200 [Desulfobacterales bacterium]|nr:hypothetical protein [Desulfobacterales bacterium]
MVVLNKDSDAFKVRREDWDEKSSIFESQFDQVKYNLVTVLKELKGKSPKSNFNIQIRRTNKFIYGNLVIFNKELYHYTLNSNAWKIDDGVSIQSKKGTKLSKLFRGLFEKTFNNGDPFFFHDSYIPSKGQINKENLDEAIKSLSA